VIVVLDKSLSVDISGQFFISRVLATCGLTFSKKQNTVHLPKSLI